MKIVKWLAITGGILMAFSFISVLIRDIYRWISSIQSLTTYISCWTNTPILSIFLHGCVLIMLASTLGLIIQVYEDMTKKKDNLNGEEDE